MKYELTGETQELNGKELHRIVCVTAFASVAVGETGGWVESEDNLSQDGNAWVYGDAQVYDNAQVFGNARVYDNSQVYGNARVYGDALVSCNAQVLGNARVMSEKDYIVLKNTWSSGRYFTYTASNSKWSVGCFYGTGEELVAKAFNDSELSGKCYEAAVKFVEELERIKKEFRCIGNEQN